MTTVDDSIAFETEVDQWLVSCYAHPLRYVLGAWTWGVGALEGSDGPKPWQRQFLLDLGAHVQAHRFNGRDPVPTVKMAISSGVGPGKTALLAWVLHWLMDTRPDCKCRVTANTVTQLETVTWAEVRKWGALKLTANRWTMTSEQLYATGDRVNWFAVRTTCAPENAQAFAGWHNRTSTTANFYDEGGTIPEEIFEKGRGIEVDGESFQFVFGQCSRRSGQLHRAVFGAERDAWDHRIINGYDVVTSPVVLAKYKEWEDTYGGEDCDYCRVHIKGLPPNADELQYIDHLRVLQATKNSVQIVQGDPLIAGVDVSGGGSAWSVCRFRRGNDARSIPPIRLTGQQTVANDRALLVSKLANALNEHAIDAMFIDSAFGAVIVSKLRDMGFKQVFEVTFGGESPELMADGKTPRDANMRAFMYRKCKEWLPLGCIPERDQRLQDDLEGPGYHINRRNQLVIESKESMADRGVPSPDDGDGLVLTFAQKVRAKAVSQPIVVRPVQSTVGVTGWMS
jgi:hypothetical protein